MCIAFMDSTPCYTIIVGLSVICSHVDHPIETNTEISIENFKEVLCFANIGFMRVVQV